MLVDYRQVFGWLSTICFAISPLFMAWDVAAAGHARGINGTFLALWGVGEVFAVLYALCVFGLRREVWPLYTNYFLNSVGLGIIVRYKLFPEAI